MSATKWAMTILYDQIAQRAFDIWEREGRPNGQDQDHWHRAEAELRREGQKDQTPEQASSPAPDLFKPERDLSLKKEPAKAPGNPPQKQRSNGTRKPARAAR